MQTSKCNEYLTYEHKEKPKKDTSEDTLDETFIEIAES